MRFSRCSRIALSNGSAARRNKRSQQPVLFALLLTIPILVRAYSTGPPPGYTGGFSEPNCTACHSTFAVNSGDGSVSIAVPATYASGTTYTIIVTVSDPAQMRWGFELSARTPSGLQAGTLVAGPDGFTQRLADIGSVQFIGHTSDGTRLGTTGGVNFELQWIAPDVSTGLVIFNAAGNAANGNLNNTGDRIYTTSATSQPEAAAPTIQLSPTWLTFTAAAGGPNPANKGVSISNSGGGTLNWTATPETSSGGSWLGVAPGAGTGAATLIVSASIGGLAAGVYEGTITAAAPGATNTPQMVAVTLNVAARRRGQLISD